MSYKQAVDLYIKATLRKLIEEFQKEFGGCKENYCLDEFLKWYEKEKLGPINA